MYDEHIEDTTGYDYVRYSNLLTIDALFCIATDTLFYYFCIVRINILRQATLHGPLDLLSCICSPLSAPEVLFMPHCCCLPVQCGLSTLSPLVRCKSL